MKRKQPPKRKEGRLRKAHREFRRKDDKEFGGQERNRERPSAPLPPDPRDPRHRQGDADRASPSPAWARQDRHDAKIRQCPAEQRPLRPPEIRVLSRVGTTIFLDF